MFTKMLALFAALTGLSSINMTWKDNKADKTLTYEIREFTIFKDANTKKWKISRTNRWLMPKLLKKAMQSPDFYKSLVEGEDNSLSPKEQDSKNNHK